MEFLKEYLGDALYAQVAEKLKETDKVKLANLAGGEYVAKAKYEAAEKKAQELSEQLAGRDSQLAELKKAAGDNEALAKQIKELQDANTTTAKEYEEKLKATERDYALREALKTDFKARDVVSVLPHLKQDAILFADGKFTGLSEQVEALKKDKAFLFEQPGESIPGGTGGAPGTFNAPPPEEMKFDFAALNNTKTNKE